MLSGRVSLVAARSSSPASKVFNIVETADMQDA
jgi:hypothetical protein